MYDKNKGGYVYEIPPFDELKQSERNMIKEMFKKKADYYCNIMGVTYGRISIRNQKTRWGSCSSLGNLNFNYRLFFMPDELMDYVIVHELCHRIHMNHSKQFWDEVEKYYPEYRKAQNILRKYRGN